MFTNKRPRPNAANNDTIDTDDDNDNDHDDEEQRPPPKPYKIDRVSERRVVKYGVEEYSYRAKFSEDIRHDRIGEVREDLRDMFQEILDTATGNYQKGDRVRMSIEHRSLDKPITINLQPKHNVTVDVIMSRWVLFFY